VTTPDGSASLPEPRGAERSAVVQGVRGDAESPDGSSAGPYSVPPTASNVPQAPGSDPKNSKKSSSSCAT
jgi:hypothetical protein